MQKNTEPCPASSAPIETGARPGATASADTLNPAVEPWPVTGHGMLLHKPDRPDPCFTQAKRLSAFEGGGPSRRRSLPPQPARNRHGSQESPMTTNRRNQLPLL
jgi:hypothetical protein